MKILHTILEVRVTELIFQLDLDIDFYFSYMYLSNFYFNSRVCQDK